MSRRSNGGSTDSSASSSLPAIEKKAKPPVPKFSSITRPSKSQASFSTLAEREPKPAQLAASSHLPEMSKPVKHAASGSSQVAASAKLPHSFSALPGPRSKASASSAPPDSGPMLEALRSEAIHRSSLATAVLSNEQSPLHAHVTAIRKKWLGMGISNEETAHHLHVMSTQLPRTPLTASERTDGNSIGFVAGRPTPSRFPGLATPDLPPQKLDPPGITLRTDKLPATAAPEDVHNARSDFGKRTWTVIHEASHAILGTHDYRTYFAGKPSKETIARAKLLGPDTRGYYTEQRPLTQSKDLARNADSWAGFVMESSEHIKGASAAKIQSTFRAFSARKKAPSQASAEPASKAESK